MRFFLFISLISILFISGCYEKKVSIEKTSDAKIIEKNETSTKEIESFEDIDQKYPYKPIEKKVEYKGCGDGVCQSNEDENCPDCPLSCISMEFCNLKIDVFSFNFSPEESLLKVTYEYQNEAFDCLKDYFGYSPKRRVRYQITKAPFVCSVNGSVCGGGHTASTYQVNSEGFSGGIDYGESYVTNPENIEMDIHETTHVFTMNALGSIPLWFNEGISEYITENLDCSPHQQKKTNIYNYNTILYNDLKEGKTSWKVSNTSEFGQKYNLRLEDSHTIGTMFFIGLGEDYDCGLGCIQKILTQLHIYRESFKDKTIDGYYISNDIIKEKVDMIVGKDTTPLFSLLKINVN